MVWHKRITKSWMSYTRSTRIMVRHKNERNVNYSLWVWILLYWCTSNCELSVGFEILAFPCNQFRSQEPGSSEEIQNVVCTRFKAEFPIFEKVITVIFYPSSLILEAYSVILKDVPVCMMIILKKWNYCRLKLMERMRILFTSFWRIRKVEYLEMGSSGTSPNSW